MTDLAPVAVRYLAPHEKPAQDGPWLVIVAVPPRGFELVFSVSRDVKPVTFTTDSTLEQALARAIRIAEDLQMRTLYVMGVSHL